MKTGSSCNLHLRQREKVELLMGHGVGLYLGLDEIGSPSPMMIFIIIISYLFIRTFWIYLLGFSVGAYK